MLITGVFFSFSSFLRVLKNLIQKTTANINVIFDITQQLPKNPYKYWRFRLAPSFATLARGYPCSRPTVMLTLICHIVSNDVACISPVCRICNSEYLDFLLYKYHKHKPVKPFAGCMKGTVTWMSDDFNEPLDDFKDYM